MVEIRRKKNGDVYFEYKVGVYNNTNLYLGIIAFL